MKVIKPSIEVMTTLDKNVLYGEIERAARTCYKSEDKITDDSAVKMVKALVKNQHLAMLEHASVTVKFICDRGVTHEMVRHRMASYAQESTRYCNYSQGKFGSEITVIEPCFLEEGTPQHYVWYTSCLESERSYNSLIKMGCTPQEARSILPISLKTEIVVKMNLREWLHFFNLRVVGTTGAPHPQIKEVAFMALEKFAQELPEVFGEQYGQVVFEKED